MSVVMLTASSMLSWVSRFSLSRKVSPSVDRGHAARTKFFLDGVLVREDSLETV